MCVWAALASGRRESGGERRRSEVGVKAREWDDRERDCLCRGEVILVICRSRAVSCPYEGVRGLEVDREGREGVGRSSWKVVSNVELSEYESRRVKLGFCPRFREKGLVEIVVVASRRAVLVGTGFVFASASGEARNNDMDWRGIGCSVVAGAWISFSVECGAAFVGAREGEGSRVAPGSLGALGGGREGLGSAWGGGGWGAVEEWAGGEGCEVSMTRVGELEELEALGERIEGGGFGRRRGRGEEEEEEGGGG